MNTTSKYQDIPARRLRVRRVDDSRHVELALAEAREKGLPVIRATHGGGVANKYGYPAETEGCITVAWPDGRVWQRVVRLPANKVTLAGVFRAVTSFSGLFDSRYSEEAKASCRKDFLSSCEESFEAPSQVTA